ncbi:PAS domain S-box protein [Flavobacterium sp. TMP13]|uniref:PAS domain S-box protein n=1 Tax=Flavobacterium sp. TMP13 TaxID=3425950 RepID=UPI003D77F69A
MLVTIIQNFVFSSLKWNSILGYDFMQSHEINDFINKYGYDIPLFAIIAVGIFSLSLLLFYKFSHLSTELKANYFVKYQEKEITSKEYQLYFLFIAITIVLSELIYEVFSIRSTSMLATNTIIGSAMFFIYYLSQKYLFIFDRIQKIFTFCIILFFMYVCRNLIVKTTEVIPTMSFLVLFFFAYNFIKPVKLYFIFTAFVFLFLITVLLFGVIPSDKAIILLNFSITILVINQIRHIISLNIKDKFRFANEIIQKANSLTVVCNQKGEFIFCSESIQEILGYTPDEVLGMEYWRLTEDTEFVGIKYFENHDETNLYTRKLKCKNGEYKYILWKDKRFSENLIIGIGQDITEQYITNTQFKNLIQSASDIIFDLDDKGHFTFVNDFAVKKLQYTATEVLGLHYNLLIPANYQKITYDFYEGLEKIGDDFPIIEIPLLKKNGQEIWVSQKVIVRKNDQGEIIGYSGIARDISNQRKQETENTARLIKINQYNEALKNLSTTNYKTYQSSKSVIAHIIKEAAKSTSIDAVSFWRYNSKQIKCKYIYANVQISEQRLNSIFLKEDYPIYFKSIESKNQIIVNDSLSKYETSEFDHDYLNASGNKSLIDSAIYVNGQLYGIVCFESKNEKEWDGDAANFAKTVSDILSLAIATQISLKREKKLKYKSKLLSALALCTEKFLSNKAPIDMFKQTFSIIGKASKSDHVFYYEQDPETKLITQKVKYTRPGIVDAVRPLRLHTPENMAGIIERGKQKLVSQIITSKLEEGYLKQALFENEIKSILILPLYINEEFTGFIAVDDCKNERTWSGDDLYVFQSLTNNISTFLEKIKGQERIIQSEEKFDLIANNIPGTVYLSKYDDFSTKIFLNDEIEKLTGYCKTDFLENKISFLSLIHPQQRENVVKKQKRDLKNGKPVHSTYQIKKKNGQYVWIEEYADVIKRGNEIDYVGGIYFDITHKKDSEDAIKAKKIAESASKSKSKFLANMSHEIRTPLNGIIGFTDLLLKTQLESIQEKYLTTVNQSAQTLLEIINDILDFSKIEAGKLELNIDKYSIKEILSQVIDLISYESTVKNLKLDLKIDSSLPTYFCFDVVRIKQILINLLSNAVKFTETGTITLSVAIVEKIDAEHFKLRFAVTDTGIGILEENKKKIFKAFSQEDSSTTRKFGGTGLGLTISNKLLKLMDSELNLDSQVDIGSTFYFEIILSTCDEFVNFEGNKPEIVYDILKNGTANRVMTFLIVEDNHVNMLLLKTTLKNLFVNCIIFHANNGHEGVELFKIINPDMVFMDIEMPIMNGYEATKAIRKLPFGDKTPIIAVTAGVEKEEKNKCLKAGMNHYISKPIIKGHIENTVIQFFNTNESEK